MVKKNTQTGLLFTFYPHNIPLPSELQKVIDTFTSVYPDINSNNHQLQSNEVLLALRDGLENIGYDVEKVERDQTNPKKILKKGTVNYPVLYGANNIPSKTFQADALSSDGTIIIEVEAGQALDNFRFLKDLFEACVSVSCDYLVIAVQETYKASNKGPNGQKDYEKISMFFETLYASNRLVLPLKGVLLIGY